MESLPPSRRDNPAARPGLRRKIATVAVMTGLVVSAFETTVVTSAMPTIARELGGLSLYAWVFSAFLVASVVAVPVFGKLADRLGRRPVFGVGMALFLLGSVLCGTAQSMTALVIYRVVQGLGVGAIGPIVPTISADLYTLEERAKVQGVFTAAWGLANVAGPVIGGFIVMHLSWRWIFLVNVPFGIAAVVLLSISYVDPKVRASGSKIDVVAATSLAVALGALLLALERGLFEGLVRASMLGLAVLAGVTFYRQQRRAADPLVPFELLVDPVVRAGTIGSVFAGALIYVPAAYVPLWVTREAGGSALRAGAALVPMLVGWALGSTLGVKAMVRWGMRAVAVGGMSLASIGATALALATHQRTPLSIVFASLFVLGFGLGPAANSAMLGPQVRVGWSARGVVTSLVHAARALGGSLAVAVLGALAGDAAGIGARCFAALAVVSWCGVGVLAWISPRSSSVSPELRDPLPSADDDDDGPITVPIRR